MVSECGVWACLRFSRVLKFMLRPQPVPRCLGTQVQAWTSDISIGTTYTRYKVCRKPVIRGSFDEDVSCRRPAYTHVAYSGVVCEWASVRRGSVAVASASSSLSGFHRRIRLGLGGEHYLRCICVLTAVGCAVSWRLWAGSWELQVAGDVTCSTEPR
jgi:hypothetical protein